MIKIIPISQDSADFLEKEINDFLFKILGFNPGSCFITDESSLRDFSGCGLTDDIYELIEKDAELLNVYETDRNKRFSNFMNVQLIYWKPFILEKIFNTYKIEINDIDMYLIDIVRKINTNNTIH